MSNVPLNYNATSDELFADNVTELEKVLDICSTVRSNTKSATEKGYYYWKIYRLEITRLFNAINEIEANVLDAIKALGDIRDSMIELPGSPYISKSE